MGNKNLFYSLNERKLVLRVIKTEVLQRVKFELEHLPCKELYILLSFTPFQF